MNAILAEYNLPYEYPKAVEELPTRFRTSSATRR